MKKNTPEPKKRIIRKSTQLVVDCDNNSCGHNTCHKTINTAGTCKLSRIKLTKHWVGSEKYYDLKCENASDIIK